jgi:transcriptional regulator with XRE-family HTH domain
MREYCRRRDDLLEVGNRLAGVTALCERRIGQELRRLPKRTGGDAWRALSGEPTEGPPSLEDLGFKGSSGRERASAYKELADDDVTEQVLLDAIALAGKEGRSISKADIQRAAREQTDADRLHRIVELRSKGWSWARIGKVVGLSPNAVGNIIRSLPADPAEPAEEVTQFSEVRETAQPEPELPAVAAPEREPEPEAAVPKEELDLAAGEPDLLEDAAAEATPVEDYIARQKETEAREAELRQKMFELKEQDFSQREIADALQVDKAVVERYFSSLKPAKDAASKRTMSETRQTENASPGDEVIEQVDAWDRPINADDDYGIPPERDEGPAEPVYSTGADGLPQAEMFTEVVTEAAPEPEPEDEAEAEVDPLAAPKRGQSVQRPALGPAWILSRSGEPPVPLTRLRIAVRNLAGSGTKALAVATRCAWGLVVYQLTKPVMPGALAAG